MAGISVSQFKPFGVLDEAIHHLDSASEPWSVHIELRLNAALDEARLRGAVDAALDRHPRARARMATARGRRRGYLWRVAPEPDLDPFDVVDCDGDDALAQARGQFESEPVSLRLSPPLRIRLLRHGGGDVVILNLHHAAGDGVAALVFLQSVARAYGARPEAVADRTSDALVGPTARHRDRLRTVLGEWREATKPSARIVADGGREAPGYGLQVLSLGVARTRALMEHARDGATVNDLLVAALHLTVETWNRDHGRPTGRVSVLMPVNLRPRPRWRSGFTNMTFMVPVATLPRDRLGAAATVDAVRRRTRRVKDDASAAAVVTCLQRLRWLPLAVRRWIARQAAHERRMATILLSNLGVLEHDLDFGPGVGSPADVWFSPPARMPLGMAVGALTAGGTLRLTFRVRHPLLGPDAAARFAACYESALDEVIEAHQQSLRPPASPRRAAQGRTERAPVAERGRCITRAGTL